MNLRSFLTNSVSGLIVPQALGKSSVEKFTVSRRSFLKQSVAMGLAFSARPPARPALAADHEATKIESLPTLETVWREEPVPIGLRKQLLADDFAISQWSNMTREMGRAFKENGSQPILTPDKPWEDLALGSWLTVLHDGEKFQMWTMANANFSIGYAESSDGFRWTKPNLGIYDFDPAEQIDSTGFNFPKTDFRGKQNNLIGDFGNGFTLFRDSHETDPAHRYKAIYGAGIRGIHRTPEERGVAMAYSHDGIHDWTPYNDGKAVAGPANDTINQVLWDEEALRYRLYTRQDYGTPGGAKEIRGCRHETNPSVRTNPSNWTTVRAWKFDRQGMEEYKRRQIMYLTNSIYGGVHFGLLGLYDWPTGEPPRWAARKIAPQPAPGARRG